MKSNPGVYQDIYIKKDEEFVSLKNDVADFCEKFIKDIHPKNWDWSKRDFKNPVNEPTIEEARAIRNIVYKDLNSKIPTDVDLSTIKNVESVKAFLNPKSKHEEFNMTEFAFSLKVELEHGRVKDVNVTNNHPFLTAMIVLAHMSESLTYYKRLKVMEAESKLYELVRKIQQTKVGKDKLYKDLYMAEIDFKDAKKELAERLEKMDDIPVMKEIGD